MRYKDFHKLKLKNHVLQHTKNMNILLNMLIFTVSWKGEFIDLYSVLLLAHTGTWKVLHFSFQFSCGTKFKNHWYCSFQDWKCVISNGETQISLQQFKL